MIFLDAPVQTNNELPQNDRKSQSEEGFENCIIGENNMAM